MAFQTDVNAYYRTRCYGDWGYFPDILFKEGSPYNDSGIIMKGGNHHFQKERVWNVLSYVPILNVVIGVIRLMNAYATDEKNSSVGNMQKLRGVCDIFLGPLNMIIDLVVTVARIRIANSAA